MRGLRRLEDEMREWEVIFARALTPRGVGTSYAGGAVPEVGGIVMDMSRMNNILKISIDDRLVVVQPGVVYAKLAEALDPYGFFFPPDPASGKAATLGTNVATNAAGLKGVSIFGNRGIAKGYLKGPDSGKVTSPSSKMNCTATRAAVPTTSVHLSRCPPASSNLAKSSPSAM